MAQQHTSEWSKPENRDLRQNDTNEMLDMLLALDRMLVEVSMRLYNVPGRERSTVRKQNRRLHAAVRQHLPRLMKPARSS
ncbi:MAG TPA: hypothetical protein VH350_13155 [Candidatus Sulfotelmatobacter sp.]|jgi:hypothetical protein|nr:hypothetical protein [Candidatus Sulfotelmatobacter sp.]